MKKVTFEGFDNVSLYALLGVIIPLMIICANFVMIRIKIRKMRESLRISKNFTEDFNNKELARALSKNVIKKEAAVTRSAALVIGTSLSLRLLQNSCF